jgi:hemerythrin-like metal-binding protein
LRVFEWSEGRHPLGVSDRAGAHREFITRARALGSCPDSEFPERFKELMNHTRAHFAAEEELMVKSAFPAYGEHKEEHQRVLGEIVQFARGIGRGRVFLCRSYVQSGLPEWFELHLSTMDSALAAHLAKLRAEGQVLEVSRNTLPIL